MITNSEEIEEPRSNSFAELQKFGRFQFYQFVLLCLPVIMVSMMHVNYIFIAENVDHRCRVPECDGVNSKVDLPMWWPENVDGKCFKPVLDRQMYEYYNHTCSNKTFHRSFDDCDDWIYEHNNSIMSVLKIGCQSWKLTLVGCVHNAGMLFSMSVAGYIADKFGRKTATIFCSVGGAVGFIKIFLADYYSYLVIEFLESFLASGLYTVGVVLMLEVGGESKRVSTSVIFAYAIYFGEVCFALLAMTLKYWKHLIVIIYTPMLIFLLYAFILKESIRWQILNGRISDVKETLIKIAIVNKLKVTKKQIIDVSDKDLMLEFDAIEQKETEDINTILGSKEILKRLAVSSICFFTSSFIYYGLAIQSILLPGNKYMNFVLSSLVSFPSDLLALYGLQKCGRKITLQCSYVFLSVFLIAASCSPESISWLKIILFLFGKLGAVICFTAIYTYSLELFPTSIRGTLFGVACTTARVGSMLAPLTLLLKGELDILPSILFGSTAIFSALLLLFTSETKNMPMFDTITQIENYKKNNFVTTNNNKKCKL